MISDESLRQFGIKAEDEWTHPFSQDHDDWNESYFFDWYNQDGSAAGHCRIGWHPVQQRILFWLHLWNGSEWLAIEEGRLPAGAFDCDKPFAFAYDQWGLTFQYQSQSPLRQGQLSVAGFARVLTGDRQGQMLAVDVELDVTAMGPAYSRGGGMVESHSAEGFHTDRYEQPIKASGHMTIDGEKSLLEVRGERDHSWGPRPWDMQWQFFVVNNEHFSLQATEVVIPEFPLIQMGYFHALDQDMEHLTTIKFDLDFDKDNPAKAVSGQFNLISENRILSGTIETIAGSEIDITHAFSPAKRTEYRRSLVRCTFADGEQSIGWLECNRPAIDNDSST